jgi:hypothetical protein
LSLLLASKELDIIEDEDIDLTIALTELVYRATLDTRDIVREELISRCIYDSEIFLLATDRIGDTLEEMCLTETNIAIDIEWIVCRSWTTSNRITCSMSELCAWSDDEVIELISLRHETTIDSFYYLDSVY